jgi:hypoxanthine-DNA glycosylase
MTGADSYKILGVWLLARQLGLWDVYAACEREGSLDSAIRRPVVNDFAAIQRLCPSLQAIAHNGGESFKHSKHTLQLGVPVYKLPSTSPANASWSFDRKLAAWREVFEKQGLI